MCKVLLLNTCIIITVIYVLCFISFVAQSKLLFTCTQNTFKMKFSNRICFVDKHSENHLMIKWLKTLSFLTLSITDNFLWKIVYQMTLINSYISKLLRNPDTIFKIVYIVFYENVITFLLPFVDKVLSLGNDNKIRKTYKHLQYKTLWHEWNKGVEWRLCNVMFLRYSISTFCCMSNNPISSVILL